MYALIEFAGKQFKLEEGSSIKVPYFKGKIGSKVTFDKILYLDDGKNKKVGSPLLEGVNINAEITSHGKERKVIVEFQKVSNNSFDWREPRYAKIMYDR